MAGRSITREELKVLGSRRRRSTPLRRPEVRTIAVASGKGGVGKSTLLVNLALALEDAGQRVLLMDGAWGMGNVDVLLGLTPKATLLDVARGERSVEEILLRATDRLSILPGASGVEEMASLDDLRTERILCSLSSLAGAFDLILLDTASGLGRNTVHLARAADETLVVATPEPTSIVDAYATIRAITRHPRAAAPSIVVNQARSAAQARAVAARLQSVCRRGLRCEPRYLGFVPQAEEVPSSVLRQRPFFQLYPGSPCTESVRVLAARLIAEPEAEPQGIEEASETLVRFEDATA
jgi:flagellar biosynthesis protein FlhG